MATPTIGSTGEMISPNALTVRADVKVVKSIPVVIVFYFL